VIVTPAAPAAPPMAEADIGDIIRANLLRLMQERGLSCDALAERAGIPRTVLEELAIGHRFPGLELLWKLAHAFDLPCTVFIDGPPPIPRSRNAAWEQFSFTAQA
jgi:transcriptional regulator with XRE-family HTH domain